MTNCHLKQLEEQEILTDTSDSSGYQMFHVEGCLVCYWTTICNSFNLLNLKTFLNLLSPIKNRLRKYMLE